MADELVKVPADLTSPRNAKFSAKTPAAGAGEGGKDSLMVQPDNLYCPSAMESDGNDKPVPTDRSAKVSANFKLAKNNNETGTSLSKVDSVDFGTGKHSSPDQKR